MARGMKRTSKKKSSRRRTSKKSGLTKSAKKQVKKIVRGQIETKTAGHILWNGTQFNSLIDGGDPVPILPQFPQGVSEFGRLGDRLSVVSCHVKGSLSLNEDEEASVQPVRVRVMCLSQKDIKVQTQLSSFTFNRLLKVNDFAIPVENIQYTGGPMSNMFPINTELFTVHYDKQFDIVPNYLGGTGPGSGAVAGLTKNNINFSFKVPTPKKLTFTNDADTYCNNACPFIIVGYTYPSNQAADSISTTLVGFAHAVVKYKDA